MWPFKTKKPTSPPSPPEYDRPWRSMDWNEDRQKHLSTIKNFQLENTEVSTLRILLHGPVGAGKSSFFNSVNNALQGRMTTGALAQSVHTDQSFTLECTIHKVKKDRPGSFFPFTFTDIAGIHENGVSIQTDDIIKLIKGHINNGYTFNPVKPITEEDKKYRRKPTLEDRIHCLVAVIPADTVSMMDDNIFRQMKAVREKARELGIPQVIILTKVDEICLLVKENLKKIYTSKKIKQKMEECSGRLGIPVNCIFPVKNYHEERATDATIDILILDALQNIVNFANDYLEAQIDKEKEALKST